MARQELVDYIRKAKESGYNDDEIKQKLFESGWEKKDIEEAMSEQVPTLNPIDDDLFQKPKILEEENLQEKVEMKSAKKICVLSIIAFVLAFLLPPIGFILGIVSLIIILVKKKRGLGFAIAAIILGLLLSFVILFVLPLFFVRSMFTSINTQLESVSSTTLNSALCTSQVGLEVMKVGNEQRVCISDDKLALIIQNSGQKDIIRWKADITGVADTSYESNNELSVGDIKVIDFNLGNINLDEIETIDIQTYIIADDETEVFCSLPSIKYAKNIIQTLDDCNLVSWDNS